MNTQNPAQSSALSAQDERVQPDSPLSGEVKRGGAIKYRGFTINYDPPPIPIRCCDWQFWHDDYDGAPNNPGEGPADNRCGSAGSLDDAKLEIDMILEDWG